MTGEILDLNPPGIPLPSQEYFKKFKKKESEADETATSENGSF